jgi:aspartate racemase
MSKQKVIGIGGGVGPMAGVKIHEKIVQNTKATTDQEHFKIYHISRSPDIRDRTEYLLSNTVLENPAEGIFRSLKAIIEGAKAVDSDSQIVFGAPCNTFHAPRIFDRFLKLAGEEKNVQVLNMLKETGDFIHEFYPHAKKIGLMSTTGTRKVRVYNDVLEPYGFEIVEVPEKLQEELHKSIYNPDWGIKAQSNPVSKQARDNFLRYVEILEKKKVDAVILGCTEIPLALPESEINGIALIDPMDALARALIREANPKKLKPIIGLNKK